MATDMNHTHFNPTELDQPPKKTNAQSLSSQLITDDILPIVERKKKVCSVQRLPAIGLTYL